MDHTHSSDLANANIVGSNSQTREPLVSVVIPFYKHGAYLAQAVRSVEEQDYPQKELVLVDDGSPTPAAEFLRGGHSFRIIRTDNHGVSAARNRGFQESTGKYLLFLDADDVLAPDAIQAHVAAITTSPDIVLTFGARRMIDEAGRVLTGPHVCRERQNYFRMFLESNPIGGPGSCLIRRDAFGKAGGFPVGKATAEDYDLWLRLARLGRITRHTAWVLDYRTHGNNVSQQSEAMLAGTLDALDRLEPSLSRADQRRLRRGRARWVHVFRPQPGLRYRIKGMYFKLQAMLGVPIRSYVREALDRITGRKPSVVARSA